jgi:hypothetical protein
LDYFSRFADSQHVYVIMLDYLMDTSKPKIRQTIIILVGGFLFEFRDDTIHNLFCQEFLSVPWPNCEILG